MSSCRSDLKVHSFGRAMAVDQAVFPEVRTKVIILISQPKRKWKFSGGVRGFGVLRERGCT